MRKTCEKHRRRKQPDRTGRLRCDQCNVEAVSAWRRRAKATLVAEAGGKCVRCGYDRCLAAMQFHHRDPKAKGFGIATAGMTRRLAMMRREVKKCDLLCANCHAEVENGMPW